jgi:hypothetical protein
MSKAPATSCECLPHCDPENPPLKILARFAPLQMAKEGQEDFLNDFLAVMHGQAKRKYVTQQ